MASTIPGDVVNPDEINSPLDGIFGPHWNPIDNPPVPWGAILLAWWWLLPPVIYWAIDMLTRQRKRTVFTAIDPEVETEDGEGADLSCCDGLVVMLASLEHCMPQYPKAKAIAGGLGKVVDLVARHHPTDIILVHPMIGTSDKVAYGDPTAEDKPLRIMVDGEREHVRVFRHTWYPNGSEGVKVEFLMLSHPMFESRTKETIYPNPMSKRKVLCFFSLWNQAVGALLARHQPDVYHLPDFHTAVAPWYAVPKWPRLKVLLVLHNAEYQGGIATDMIRGERLEIMAKIWNLPVELVEKHLVCDGRLNMLKCAVDFVVEYQEGLGVCAVSQYYAVECMTMYSLLWSLPKVDGLDNPMLEEERAVLAEGESLQVMKTKAKAKMQAELGLNVDPNARIFVSLGRLVRQKGVDLLADCAPTIMENFPDAQLVIIGPIGDGFGHYAAKKLQMVGDNPAYKGRVFIKCEFMRVPEDLKFAADFCLMPSRDEPFGYVDIEFAWRGALLVGAQAGGLGKVPGFYYIAQNKENLGRLARELEAVIRQAMITPKAQLEEMADQALRCDFPLPAWQRNLLLLYKQILETGETGPKPKQQGDMEMQEGVGKTGAGRHPSIAEAVDTKKQSRAMSVGMPGTFAPYQQKASHASKISSPISMIDEQTTMESVNVAAGHRQTMFAAGSVWDCDNEFVTQELPEEEIAVRVQDKLAQDPTLSIDRILEMIGSEVDMEREASPVGRWMLSLTWGIHNVHWCVAAGYMASPIAEFLTFVTAAEWGSRGGAKFPAWFQSFGWFKRVFGNGGLDAPLLSIILFSSNAMGMLIGTPFWTWLTTRTEPRYIMATSLLLQVPLLIMIVPVNPTISMACFLKFCHGFASSASLLFIVFNFMMSIKGDMSKAAIRMGVLEMCRFCVAWLLTGYIFLVAPSTIEGTEGAPMPMAVTALLVPIALLALMTTLVPGILLLYAPGPYRDDRLPGWDLAMFTKRKSFLLLGLSDIFGALVTYPSLCYVSWWMANGWTSAQLGWMCFLCAFWLLGGTAFWAYALSLASVHGFSFLIGVALLLAPPCILRAVVQEEVSTFTNLGRSNVAMLICVFSLLIEGIRSSATWTAKIKVLNSRWRLLSYGTVLITMMQFMSVFSPFVSEWIARRYSSTFITRNQKELADAVIVNVIPFGIIQFVAQVLAAFFIQEDMGVSTDSERTDQGPVRRLIKRAPLMVALSMGLFLAIVAGILQRRVVGKPLYYDPVHRCAISKLDFEKFEQKDPVCTLIKELRSDPNLVATEGEHFGLNEHKSNTTARFNCRHRMLTEGADTFVYEANRCRVFECHSLSKMPTKSSFTMDEAHLEHAEVWSTHCPQHGQNLVAVHLMEWRWDEIAAECQDYLGKAGFNMIQVTPPAEHVLGDSWSIRYMPTSYKLESRSGSREDFIYMVKTCRDNGINIMVDAVINHMAAPFVQNPKRDRGKECNGEIDNETHSTRKCRGWTGQQYFNRNYPNGRPQKDQYSNKHFHHFQGNERANCGLPPWTNNRHQCDLYGLPDLDTEDDEVRRMIQTYLWDLFEIGVTMLRIDAALNIYPQSLAVILEPFPWDYIVQEYYPGMLYIEKGTLNKAMRIGSLTDFTFGQRVAEAIFPGRKGDGWTSRDENFGDLLGMSQHRTESCGYNVCDSPIPDTNALLFLDNHDQQRERWKPEHKIMPDNGVCWWNGKDIQNCRPIYKHGKVYNLAQLYMLSWPYGEAVRLTSSYGWKTYDQGPPGVRPSSIRDIPARRSCRDMPATSPTKDSYEDDKNKHWVCEHRWTGVAGLVRFRRLVGRNHPVQNAFKDKEGHISYSMGKVGFVAFNKGHNWFAETGNDKDWDLAADGGRMTQMPDGKYCNLASDIHPIPGPDDWKGDESACKDEVEVAGGKITKGLVKSDGAVVIHVSYKRADSPMAMVI